MSKEQIKHFTDVRRVGQLYGKPLWQITCTCGADLPKYFSEGVARLAAHRHARGKSAVIR